MALNDEPVIDFHIHLADREHWHEAGLNLIETFPGNDAESQWDGEGNVDIDRVLRMMDDQGIEQAALIPAGWRAVALETLDIASRGRGRLHPFVTVDPRAVDEPDAILDEACARGAKGLKIHPVNIHIYPNDRSLYPLYEVARAHNIVAMFHIGSSIFPGAKHRFADPMAVDELAEDFRDLKIICAHGGRGFWEEQVFFMARIRPNVFLELSGLPPKRIERAFPDLERIRDRVLYGSDWPTSPALGEVAKRFRSLPLSDDALRQIMYENAHRLLGLSN